MIIFHFALCCNVPYCVLSVCCSRSHVVAHCVWTNGDLLYLSAGLQVGLYVMVLYSAVELVVSASDGASWPCRSVPLSIQLQVLTGRERLWTGAESKFTAFVVTRKLTRIIKWHCHFLKLQIRQQDLCHHRVQKHKSDWKEHASVFVLVDNSFTCQRLCLFDILLFGTTSV